MSYGLRIENPSGQLVLTSDSPMFRYFGQATMVGVNTYPGRNYRPTQYEFNISVPSEDTKLIAFIRLSTSLVLLPNYYYRAGTQWRFFLASVLASDEMVDQAPPGIDIFTMQPGGASNSGFGLEMFDASGVRTMAMHDKPLMFSATSSHYGTSSTSDIGDEYAAFSRSLSQPSMLWTDVGGHRSTGNGTTGREWEYGWRLSPSGGGIDRKRVLVYTDPEAAAVYDENVKYAMTNFYIDMARD